jgi:retron-type reverse transcriptase
VLDADIRDYFGSIDHDKLMKLVERRVSDRRMLTLLRGGLEAGVMEGGAVSASVVGVPQGGVISPLLYSIDCGRGRARCWARSFDTRTTSSCCAARRRNASRPKRVCERSSRAWVSSYTQRRHDAQSSTMAKRTLNSWATICRNE